MGRKKITIPTQTPPPAPGAIRRPLTAKEAAEHFRMSYWQFTRMSKKGEIPRHKIGHKWWYYADEIDRASYIPAMPQ